MKSYIRSISLKFTRIVVGTIASWKFVFFYTMTMITWVILHKKGILHIDSNDFSKYNLFLSLAAGIQASIILMYSNRESSKDRLNILKGIELDKQTLSENKNILEEVSKLNQVVNKIDKIEQIITLLELEGTENEKNKKSKKRKIRK